jgi:hypothetical protein
MGEIQDPGSGINIPIRNTAVCSVPPAALDFITKVSYCRMAFSILFEISPLALW